MAGRIGWYRLKSSGRAFHGTIPLGAEEIDGPDGAAVDDEGVVGPQSVARALMRAAERFAALDDPGRAEVEELVGHYIAVDLSGPLTLGDQLVESPEGGTPVGADVAGLDLSADAQEVGEGPVGDGGPAGQDDVDGTSGRQGQKRTRARKPAQGVEG